MSAIASTSVLGFRDKIMTPESLVQVLEQKRCHPRSSGTLSGSGSLTRPIVVQCHGCFDIVHPGHIRYLQAARAQGDLLVVSITGDARIEKGTQRPYIPEELRAENLAALTFVDYVVIDPHPTAAEVLDLIRPDVYVKGREYATSDDPRFLAERAIVEGYGGLVVFSSGDVVFSSSRIVDLMAEEIELSDTRLALVCQRHGVSRSAIGSLLDAASGKLFVVYGDAFIERYVLCDDGAMSTESPMMSLRELDQRDFPGGAAFIALQLAALGARPVLVTSQSGGPLSNRMCETLRQHGVEVRPIVPSGHVARDGREVDCAVNTRYLVEDKKVFRIHRSGAASIDSALERAVCAELTSAAEGDAALILYDAGFGAFSPGLRRAIQDDLRLRFSFVAGACGDSQSRTEVFNEVDLACCSERRLRAALNERDAGLSTLAYRLMQDTGARRLIGTLGKCGLVTFDRPSHDRSSPSWGGRLLSEYLPAFGTQMVDRLGAGDTLFASAALAVACGGNLMQAAYLGAISAGLAIDRLGPSTVTADEIRRVTRHRRELAVASMSGAERTAAQRERSSSSHEPTAFAGCL
ncbi:MAG: adenylyltransferase/cytidyltransferase family protein [Phycisphaerae bacterium]|nr:adenylyltransferase/cytidyltransferase family protein [Phycisphaerae bacterium]